MHVLTHCKTRSSCATHAHICEVTHEDDDLLDHATQPPRRIRIPFPGHLLVAPSARGVSEMAAAAERTEPTGAIRSDTHGGQTRSLAADVSGLFRLQVSDARVSDVRSEDHKGGGHVLSDMSLCHGEHQQPSH